MGRIILPFQRHFKINTVMDSIQDTINHFSGPKPSIGRIVRFVDIIGQDNAAIMTAVAGDDIVNLTVFPDQSDPYIAKNVQYAEDGDFPRHLSWHWPPRD